MMEVSKWCRKEHENSKRAYTRRAYTTAYSTWVANRGLQVALALKRLVVDKIKGKTQKMALLMNES